RRGGVVRGSGTATCGPSCHFRGSLSGPARARGVCGAGSGGVVIGGVPKRNMWRSVTVSGGVAQHVAFPDPLEPGSRAAEGRRSEPLMPAAVTGIDAHHGKW